MPGTAVVWVPDGAPHQRAHWVAIGVEHCARQGYELVGVAHGDAGWASVWRQLCGGVAEILVVPRRAARPPGPPRVELA